LSVPRKLPTDFWFCMVYGLISAVVIFLFTRGGIALSSDSINYLSIAKMINVGPWSESFVITSPPFFPTLIALVSSLGFAGEESARLISLISYSALVILMFLLARATAGRLVAHLTSVSILLFAPLLFVYSHCWSETVYITLSAGSLLALYKFYESIGGRGRRYLIWGALLIGLALLTRYIGIALFSAGFLIVLLKKEVKHAVDKIRPLLLLTLISCGPLALYLAGGLCFKGRSLRPTGHAMPSLWAKACSFVGTVYQDFLSFDFSFTDPGLLPYKVGWQSNMSLHILGNIAGVIFLILLVSFFSSKSARKAIRNQIVPVVYVACYSVSLVLITSLWVRLPVTTRFCSPIYPFLIALGFVVIVGISKTVARRGTKSLCLGASAVAVGLFWFVQSVFGVNLYGRVVTTPVPKVEMRDITGDGIFDVSDLLYLTNYLYKGGPQPRPLQNANVNCDETVNIADLIYLVNYIYRDGPPPCTLEKP
jgi:4-amino-4-deoxy-L-arabinose transferase-like glycosyltransferase